MLNKLLAMVLLMELSAVAADTPTQRVTFNKDVLPILQRNCQVCHRPGQVAPMSLITYRRLAPGPGRSGTR